MVLMKCGKSLLSAINLQSITIHGDVVLIFIFIFYNYIYLLFLWSLLLELFSQLGPKKEEFKFYYLQ